MKFMQKWVWNKSKNALSWNRLKKVLHAILDIKKKICDGYFKDLSQAFDYALEDIITLKDFNIKVSNNCKHKEKKQIKKLLNVNIQTYD